MMLHALALAALMARCAPTVAPATMTAIVRVESGGNPLAIGDNTARRSYYPHNRAAAERLARRLLTAGHLLDLGIAQIDSMNLAGFGVTADNIFDPCTNLSIGARILSDDYVFAAQRYRDAQVALRHAIGMYNTGRLNGGASYVARVLVAARIREEYVSGPQVVSQHDARRSPILIRLAMVHRGPPAPRRSVVTPSRSPILVTVAPTAPPQTF